MKLLKGSNVVQHWLWVRPRYKVERTFWFYASMVWCWNSKIRRTFKNTCAAYYGIHCLQLIPNTRDYCVKFYQIRGKYTDKRLLSTQKVTSSGIFWSKIFILLRVYGWKLRGCRFCRGLPLWRKTTLTYRNGVSLCLWFAWYAQLLPVITPVLQGNCAQISVMGVKVTNGKF